MEAENDHVTMRLLWNQSASIGTHCDSIPFTCSLPVLTEMSYGLGVFLEIIAGCQATIFGAI